MLVFSPAVVGFLAGASVVIVPLIFNLIKELYFDQRKRKEERAYISVQLIFLLDKFVDRCAMVAWDDGHDSRFAPPDDSELEAQTTIPVFDMSSTKGEHKYLEPQMLAKLHSIDIKLRLASEKLHNEDNDWFYTGQNWMYYELRREVYAEVGLFAASIAEELRGIFDVTYSDEWRPIESIKRSKLKLQEIKSERERVSAENKKIREEERRKRRKAQG